MNPFESATLNLNAFTGFRVDDPEELRSRTLDAIESSSHYAELKLEMDRVLQESRQLAEESVSRVVALLAALGLDATPRRVRRFSR